MNRPVAVVERPESDLIARARKGDRGAFGELLRQHLSRVWAIVWRILRHREDTEDVVQEVFLAAHQALPGYRGESQFSTWLHRIAVNRALNHRSLAAEKLRRASETIDESANGVETAPIAVQAAVLAAIGSSPLKDLEMKELRRHLADCLSRLPAAWRAVIALQAGESLTYEEISRVTGTAVGTVRSRLARARMALRRCVEGEAA